MDPEVLRGSIALAGQHMRSAAHHLASFNRFIETTLPRAVAEKTIRVPCIDQRQYVRIQFDDVQLVPPTLVTDGGLAVPLDYRDALLRRLTYNFDLYATVTMVRYAQTATEPRVRYTPDKQTVYLQLHLGSMPAMLGSIVCRQRTDATPVPVAHEGCFIINGLMRHLTSQESLLNNQVYVRRLADSYRVELRSTHIHSRSTSTLYINTTETVRGGLNVVLKVPFVASELPLVRFLVLLQQDETPGLAPEAALECVRTCVAAHAGAGAAAIAPRLAMLLARGLVGTPTLVRQALESPEFLPHCADRSERIDVLCLCLARLLLTIEGVAAPTDIDSYAEKRMLLPGELYEQQFLKSFSQLARIVQRRVFKAVGVGEFVDLADIVSPRYVTSAFRYAFATSNFPVGGGTAVGKGVSQLASSSARIQSSAMQTVNKTISRDGVSEGPRRLHRTALGILCSAESPESRSVGLSNVLACLSFPSPGYKGAQVSAVLRAAGLIDEVAGGTPVRVNGKRAGWTRLAWPALVERVDRMRREGTLPLAVGVFQRFGDVHVACVRGMCVRGMRVEATADGPLAGRIGRLVGAGFRLVCKNEELARPGVFANISDAMTLFGRSAIMIPFGGHTQSPRLIYASVMSKQAVEGRRAGDHTHVFVEHKTYELVYPQRRLVHTVGEQVNAFPEASANVVIAIMADPHTEEDGVVVKQSSVDRGLLTTMFSRTTPDSERDGTAFSERFGVPITPGSVHSYTHLDPATGLARVGSVVRPGDILVGKVITPKLGAPTDRSVPMRSTEDTCARVTDALLIHSATPGATHLRTAIVRTAAMRPLQVGNKLSNFAAQKTSICDIRADVDMPFCRATGMIPDVILGAHAMPSRMTVNLLLEMLAGKHAAIAGRLWDATSFDGLGIEEVLGKASAVLLANGLPASGKEWMCDGVTGRPIDKPVYIGLISCMALKHFVVEKSSARKSGPTQFLTRQPVAGRSRCGGGRFGAQEQTALVCHGAMNALRDRMLVNSDAYTASICVKCRQLSTRVLRNDTVECCFCREAVQFEAIEIPFTLKLLAHELAATGIALRF